MALVLQLSSQSVLGSWDCRNTGRVVQTTDLDFSQSRDWTVPGQRSGELSLWGSSFSWLRDGASSLCPQMAERAAPNPLVSLLMKAIILPRGPHSQDPI